MVISLQGQTVVVTGGAVRVGGVENFRVAPVISRGLLSVEIRVRQEV